MPFQPLLCGVFLALSLTAQAQFNPDSIPELSLAEQRLIDITFTATDGRLVSTGSLKGKVVLVDFWASWCTNHFNKYALYSDLYEKYSDQGFDIIGINLDNKSLERKVSKVIEKHQMTWPQRFEGLGFAVDEYARTYKVRSIPTTWLLDKNGVRVAINTQSDQLEPLIKHYLEVE